MATIGEVAEKSGVSIATVSNIVNGKGKASKETVERVMRVIKELNYKPNMLARNLKTKKSRSIGVIVEDMTIFSIPDIVDGITDYCDKENYQIFLINLRLFMNYNDTYYDKDFYYGRVKEEIHKLENLQVEGIIYVTAHERTLQVIPEDLDIPAVMAYGYTQSKKIPSVVVDDVEGGFSIAKKLLEQGHKKVGIITGKNDSVHAQARMLGYQKAFYEARVPMDQASIFVGDWERESGYAYVDQLLEQGVTAIMCMNDIMAGGVYDRLSERGITVGEEISVTGYDGRQLSSYYKPPLTTIALPLHDIGYKAGEVLLELLSAEEIPQDEQARVYQVPCQIVEGKSIRNMNCAKCTK